MSILLPTLSDIFPAICLTAVDPNDSLAQPPLDPALPVKQRLQAVKANLERTRNGVQDQAICKLAFDCKEHVRNVNFNISVNIF